MTDTAAQNLQIMRDCASHYDSWRKAIMDRTVEASRDDDADLTYWMHELRAFERDFGALVNAVKEQTSD